MPVLSVPEVSVPVVSVPVVVVSVVVVSLGGVDVVDVVVVSVAVVSVLVPVFVAPADVAVVVVSVDTAGVSGVVVVPVVVVSVPPVVVVSVPEGVSVPVVVVSLPPASGVAVPPGFWLAPPALAVLEVVFEDGSIASTTSAGVRCCPCWAAAATAAALASRENAGSFPDAPPTPNVAMPSVTASTVAQRPLLRMLIRGRDGLVRDRSIPGLRVPSLGLIRMLGATSSLKRYFDKYPRELEPRFQSFNSACDRTLTTSW